VEGVDHLPIYQCIRRAIKLIEVIIGEYHFANYLQNFIQHPLIIYSSFDKSLKKKWKYNKVVHQVFIEFKRAYDSVNPYPANVENRVNS
jgi:hypothetical protein